MVAGEHPVVAQVNPVHHDAARLHRPEHVGERRCRIVEVLDDGAGQDGVETDGRAVEERLCRPAGMVVKAAQGGFAGRTGEPVGEAVAIGQRLINRGLMHRVALRPVAVNRMHFFRPIAQQQQRDPEVIPRTDFGHPSGEPRAAGIREIVGIHLLDVGKGGVEVELRVAGAGRGVESAGRPASPGAPIIEKVVGAGQQHAALGQDF